MTPPRPDLVFWNAQARRGDWMVHYVFAGPGPTSRFTGGVTLPEGFPGMLCGVAEVVMMSPRPYLYMLVVSDTERRSGIGLALLKEVRRRFGEVDACWSSPAGVALAAAFERIHGPQPWSCSASLPAQEALS